MNGFDRRVVLVTGSTRGIGKAIGSRLVAEGALVAIHGTRQGDAIKVAEELGASIGVGADISDPDAVQAMVDRVTETVGPITMVVNNAGVTTQRSFIQSELDLWEQMLAINLMGPVHVLRATVPTMVDAKWGRVLNVTSAAAVEPTPGFPVYGAAKGALLSLTLTMSAELKSSGITVNALSPIAVTDMLRKLPGDKLDALVARGIPTVEQCASEAYALLADEGTTGKHVIMSFGS